VASHNAFKLYRYQILPIHRHTDDLFDGRTAADVLAEKNDIFAQAIGSDVMLKHARTDMSINIVATANNAFVLRVAPLRPIVRERQDSGTDLVDNWPHVTVIVLNRKTEQYIAVQDRANAYATTDTVVNLVQRSVRDRLERFGLRLHVEKVFNPAFFWEAVRMYSGRVTWVAFSFVTPNMSNISRTLSEELKTLSKDADAAKASLRLQSDADAALILDEDNETVRGLVAYSSEGGGDIAIKVRGLRKRIKTSGGSREISLSSLELSSSPDQLADIVRAILK
jgi:hypothetical protein